MAIVPNITLDMGWSRIDASKICLTSWILRRSSWIGTCRDSRINIGFGIPTEASWSTRLWIYNFRCWWQNYSPILVTFLSSTFIIYTVYNSLEIIDWIKAWNLHQRRLTETHLALDLKIMELTNPPCRFCDLKIHFE